MGLTLAESDTLTQQEVQILGGDNDKAKDNFKLLIKSFHDANMQNLFPLRHEIMKSISNVNGIAFSLEREDYLSENEMMILLGEITYAAL